MSSSSSYIIHASSDKKVESELKNNANKIVFIKFTAKWCGPCKYIAPYYKKYAKEYPDIAFLEVDIDKCTQTTIKFNVSAMPTFCVVQVNSEGESEILETFVGANPQGLEKLISNYA